MPVTQNSSLGSPPTENSCANCGLQRPFENCGNKLNVVAVVVVVDVNSRHQMCLHRDVKCTPALNRRKFTF